MAHRVVIAPAARADLVDIGDFIAADSPANAERWVARLEEAIQSLSFMPERVQLRDDLRSGYRAKPVGSYLIFFRVVEDEVQIVRVLHASRDVTEAFNDDR